MAVVTDDVLSRMVETIVREIDPEQVYLFGSRARGDSGQDSDVDLMVVERDPFGPERSRLQETRRIYRAVSSFHIAADILVYSSDEIAKWSSSINHVIGRCKREGRLLYARH